MVQPPPPVGHLPVLVAIAPPRIELLLGRHEMAHRVMEPRRHPRREPLGFRRRVADHVEQLLVAPHVMLQRRDIEVPHQHRPLQFVAPGEIQGRLAHEIQLVPVFHIRLPIRHIAAGRHVEIMQLDPAPRRLQPHRQMPAIALAAPIRRILEPYQRQFREDRHPVVALHPAIGEMRIPHRRRRLEREQLVRHLGFLQADHIRLQFAGEPAKQPEPQPQRVDVPGGDTNGLGHVPSHRPESSRKQGPA